MLNDRSETSNSVETWGDRLPALLDEVLRPRHFFVAPNLDLEWVRERRTRYWEVFHGRLLDGTRTRATRTLDTWGVYVVERGVRADEPLLALHWDEASDHVHVTRSLLSIVWVAHEEGERVIGSREEERWLNELVGTVDLACFRSEDELRDELACLVFHAVVGTSRLPLTSLEAPLPQFTLGLLGYHYRNDASSATPERDWRKLLEGPVSKTLTEDVKRLELFVRAVPRERVEEASTLPGCVEVCPLLADVFNETALSPYTDFVDKALELAECLVERGSMDRSWQIDLIARLLRQQGRHLTAYDLRIYHHQGANYPDALALDALLKAYLSLIERHARMFLDDDTDGNDGARTKRLRRRALRQGVLHRRLLENLAVPDAPTSPGENMRVLPAPWQRVPEEQISIPLKRSKHLYSGDPLTAHIGPMASKVLARSLAELSHPLELRELGMAVFLERPLGYAKPMLEPNRTPLLSHESFSRTIAGKRLDALHGTLGLLSDAEHARLGKMLAALEVQGVACLPSCWPRRPGEVSLDDACQVAEDFVLVRTTQSSIQTLFTVFDWDAKAANMDVPRLSITDALRHEAVRLIVRDGQRPGVLVVYRAAGIPWLELQIRDLKGYRTRANVELPRGGLRLLRYWPRGDGQAMDRESENIRLLPRQY